MVFATIMPRDQEKFKSGNKKTENLTRCRWEWDWEREGLADGIRFSEKFKCYDLQAK
jgi:hypothetical protein